MIRILLILLALAAPAWAEYPTVNVPPSLRQENWGTGSCVHASLISLLRWQGRHNTAAYWRAKYEGGESFNGLTAKLEAEKQRYAAGFDVAFLEWACRTRRGAVITWDVAQGYHSVAVVHLDDKLAGILDNNDIGRIHWFPREAFLAHWQISGSWAVTPVYTPAPPLPR